MPTEPDSAEARVGPLRGAQVGAVDPARLGAVAAGVCMAALVVTVAVLYVAGAHRNAQTAALHDDGVPVTVRARGCQGLLGGSGSNPVGYSCRGTFTLGDRRYDVAIPGTALHPRGTTVTVIADRADPPLVSTPQAARTDKPSTGVFVLPSVLLAAVVALAALLARTRLMRR